MNETDMEAFAADVVVFDLDREMDEMREPRQVRAEAVPFFDKGSHGLVSSKYCTW